VGARARQDGAGLLWVRAPLRLVLQPVPLDHDDPNGFLLSLDP
jgi:hypothetical protein